MGRGKKRNRHKTHLTPREREAYEALERNLSSSRNKAPAGKETDFVGTLLYGIIAVMILGALLSLGLK